MYKICISLVFCLTLGQTAISQLDFSRAEDSPHALLSEMDSTIQTGKYEQITSVLVAKNGIVLFENYYNGADKTTKHNTRSVTKTMATLLTGIAIKEGHIQSEKDKIFTYLEHKKPVKHPDPRKMEITLEDLLTMSSALECNDFNSFSRGNEERMYPIEDWTGFYLDLPMRAYPFEPQPKDQPYGRAFSYCSAGAATMAEVVQTAVGMPLDNFATQHLFGPLGIQDYTLHYNPEGVLNTAGGSEYRSRDFLKLIQLCLNNGEWKGHQIIPADWLKKATTPKARVRNGVDYGYLLWLQRFGTEKLYSSYAMSGNGGQKVLALPDLNTVVVITTTNYGNRNAHNYTNAIMNDFIVPAMEN
ncbi:serine hydrolase domain-containing protein [uncultured Allomuricauda sp.]|uniref:serine hydrolase domain-containing protein n=1 Tax=Flagellimonas sp. W118 TaxID=3410791 RepID=UPI002631FEBC|nr:serine hydrolase [uncultured Allomuricauda sp.]